MERTVQYIYLYIYHKKSTKNAVKYTIVPWIVLGIDIFQLVKLLGELKQPKHLGKGT